MRYGSYSPQPYNPYYAPPRPRFGTSPIELLHIVVAMVVLAAVLFIVFLSNDGFAEIAGLPIPVQVAAALLISAAGFVLHELGHKFTAQHFGYWSEFRASASGLILALVIAVTLHIPIAAPGATWHNAQSRRDQGKISAAGPLVNYIVALAAFPFTLAADAKDTVPGQLAHIVLTFSTILAVFNLIPLGPLDGKKVLAWNPLVWVLMVGLGIGIIVYTGILA